MSRRRDAATFDAGPRRAVAAQKSSNTEHARCYHSRHAVPVRGAATGGEEVAIDRSSRVRARRTARRVPRPQRSTMA
ncbi:hypothetical protein C2U71_21490 [Burkholderia ubonensis]|nr:hypothetical protein C2U71_21490 [Burkholderia ubonensis]